MYVDRDENGAIVGVYSNPQRPDHEWVEGAAIAPQTDRAAEIRAELARLDRAPLRALAEIVAGQDTPQAQAALSDALSRKTALRAELQQIQADG